MFLSLLLVQAAWGLAPFYSQQQTVDRHVDGVHQRSYFVIFNDQAPVFGWDGKEKLVSWLELSMPDIRGEHVQWNYQITENFRGFSTWATNTTIERVLASEYVRYVEEDTIVTIAAPFTQRPDWGQMRVNQKGTRNLATTPSGYYSNGTYPSGSSDTTSWDWTTTVNNGYRLPNSGSNARIWICDTGILSTHQEFVTGGRSRVVVTQDFTGAGTGRDGNGHGTHCAGSAAGQYRGVATNAELANIRVLGDNGSGTNAGVVQGFNYVANNQAAGKMNILSASLGSASSTTTDNAINNGANAGVIPVVAAGNNNNANACSYSPAGASQAITVGATSATDARASFSNSGSCVDVFSPGQNIHSSWYTSATTYNTISGTSMATPLAAGAIAVYGTIGSNYANRVATVKTAIRNTATSGQVSGTLLAGTPNLIINSNWN